jgi:hypothetical protein
MTHGHDPHQPIVAMDEQPDSWHMHTPEEGDPQEEHGAQADPTALVAAFVGSIFFVGLVIVVCLLYYSTHTTGLRAARIETTEFYTENFVPYRQQSDRALSSYGWATPEAAAEGKVSAPIEFGMQKVLQQYGQPLGGKQ